MTPEQFARIEAITQRIHAKRHRGWGCEDMHPATHADHMTAFRKIAQSIVLAEKSTPRSTDHSSAA